uniref:PPC domain-containing protein n=1 Tax=Kalanchoe fedtschenkoi TaxID=63787 RepID=A0A7N0ZTF2_KALFE
MEDQRQTPPATIAFDSHHSSSDDGHHRSPKSNRRQRGAATARPRGRPAGSKNKPKPPIIITRESPNALRCHVMEIPPTHDIIQALADFAAKRQRGICILGATGTVINIALRQPPPPHQLPPTLPAKPAAVNFTGRFEILSMSGAFMPPPAPPSASGVSVFVGGGQGQVLGGKVVGPLVTAGLVVITASSFANTTYERLPLQEDDVGENEEEEKVTLTLPGTGQKIESLIPRDAMDDHHHHHHQEQLMSLIPTTTATPTLFHGFLNNGQNGMPAEEFWGGSLANRTPFLTD